MDKKTLLFFSIFRNKALFGLIKDIIQKNIRNTFNFYKLPLHVIIKNKRYDYLEEKINRYIEWKKDPSTEWYLELEEVDIEPLFTVAHIIGYGRFIEIYNDFKSLFDRVLKIKYVEVFSSDYNVFQYFYKQQQRHKISTYKSLDQFFSDTSRINNIQVFESMMNLSKNARLTTEIGIRSFFKSLDQKPKAFILSFLKVFPIWISSPTTYDHSLYVGHIIDMQLINVAKEYCKIIPKNQVFETKYVEHNQFGESLRKKYLTFIEFFNHNPKYFSKYGTQHKEAFCNLFVTAGTNLHSRECLDFAISLVGKGNLKLLPFQSQWISEQFIKAGDLDSILLLHEMKLFKVRAREFASTLPVLKFCMENYDLQLTYVGSTRNETFIGGVEYYEYIYTKFPSLETNHMILNMIASSPTASSEVASFFITMFKKYDAMLLNIALCLKNLSVFKSLWAHKEYMQKQPFSDQAITNQMHSVFADEQQDFLEYFIQDPILSKYLLDYVQQNGHTSIPHSQLEKMSRYFIKAKIRQPDPKKAIPLCFLKKRVNTLLYGIKTSKYSCKQIQSIISRTLNDNCFDEFSRCLSLILDTQPTTLDKSIKLFQMIFMASKSDILTKLIEFLQSTYPPSSRNSLKIENIDKHLFSVTKNDIDNIEFQIGSLSIAHENYIASIGFIEMFKLQSQMHQVDKKSKNNSDNSTFDAFGHNPDELLFEFNE
ncbi:hypothetical protein CYY_003622 [Polysphondylium violaceum]|uniref:Uncharacterized protein n=1 Tax=Polysphondylium violaceum TaxID=133409 RepID=A0A8J4PWG9_9MYCE|nr:hypothetical protein CYY_003622 [Polysphondylium violaceum]